MMNKTFPPKLSTNYLILTLMKKRKVFVIALVIFSVLLTSFSFYFYQVFYAANVLVDKNDVSIVIQREDNFESLRTQLYEADIIQDVVSFSFVAKILGYQSLVKPGAYRLQSNMTNLEVIRMLRAGNQVPVNITFNNIRLKGELAEKATANIGVQPEEFGALLNDAPFLEKYGFNPENVLTMFIPNTYEVYWTISKEALFEKMHQEYQRFWNTTRLDQAAALKLSPIEVSVLASIVQAESIQTDESPKIAGLYLNRLKKNIPLQADPTLVYAIGDFSIQRVLNEYKKIESPYNTYKYRGLPPGPINMPTITSLNAVLNYEKHNYLYMCAKEDFSGYHRFAITLTQHNQNARLFQKALNERKIFR